MSSLLRSTKFVRYFTGAARTLILNSAKTAEVNSLINPKALCAANTVLLREYATSKKAENLEPLLQRLDSEVRRYGRITKRDIDEVFDELRGKNDITSSQSLLVIRCCGQLVPEELPAQRTQLVQKIWNVLSERGVPLDISHYNALLRVYIENEHEFSPALFLDELEKKGLQPNRVTYQRLMWRYCQEGDMEGALSVLEKMRELGMPVSEPVLNALVMGHSFLGDTDVAKVVMETMSNAGLHSTNRTYALLACGYAKKGDIDAILGIITKCKDQDIYLTDKDLLEVIEHLAVSGHDDKIDQIFPHLHKSAGYNQEVCNIIFRLLNSGHELSARKVMKTMPKLTTVDDTIFKGAFYVKHLLKLDMAPDQFIQICRELQEEKLIQSAMYIATEGALQLGYTELSQKLFKELQKDGYEIRQHYYWPLLAQKAKEKDEEGLLQILRSMTSEGIIPSGEALRDYVIPCIMDKNAPQNVIIKLQIANISSIHSSRNLMVELLEAGQVKKAAEIALQYTPRGQYSLLARPLINGLNKTKDIESFATILHVISNNPSISQNDEEDSKDDVQADSSSDSYEIGRILLTAIKNLNNPEQCEQLLRVVLSKGLRISTSRAEEIENYLGNNMTTELSKILAELTSPDLERAPIDFQRRQNLPITSANLENLLKKSLSKGDKNIKSLQKQLLLAYIREKKVDELHALLDELKSTDFELTLMTLSQLLEFYCDNDDLARAIKIREDMKEKDPTFLLTRYKTVLLSFALIRADRFDDAIQFLKDEKPENEVGPINFMLNSKCWQTINYLAEKKDTAKVKDLTKTLLENNYVDPSNILLGPSIKVHLLNDDVDGALEEFENCCKQYRCTPWKGELMKCLIMKEDATRLQWLADLSTQIHGEVNILHDLVLAFVECGRLRQARRILETPGLHTRQRRLQDACERYVEEGKSEYLEGLLEATKELSHIDRANIYYHLLLTYCKAKETDKALGLWTLLQEEGEIPSDKFLLHLSQHLKANKREVPFVVPESELPVAPPKPKQEKKVQATPQVNTTKTEISNKIEKLIIDGKADTAINLVIQSIKNSVVPKTSVVKFLLKTLAEAGNVADIETLGQHFTETYKRDVTYDDKLTLANFNSGLGAKHVDKLLYTVENVYTDEDLQVALKKFPRSHALAMAISDEEIRKKCQRVAEIAASKGLILPVNLLWIEYILANKDEEANAIWNQWLVNSNIVVFRRLLQESHTTKKPELIEKLISILKTNNHIPLGSLGNAYSRLINYYISTNKIDEAQASLQNAIQNGISKEHLNNNSIQRLLEASNAAGKKFEFSI